MKTRVIGYWIATALIALVFAGGGVSDLLRSPQVIEGLTHLGYPSYFALILGTWKLLGALAVLAPGLPRLKEWAYAGFVFDLTGAALSHAASGDEASKVAVPLAITVLVVASYVLRPAARRVGVGVGASPLSAA